MFILVFSIIFVFFIFIVFLNVFLSTKKGKKFNSELEKKYGVKFEMNSGASSDDDDGIRDYIIGKPSASSLRYSGPDDDGIHSHYD